MREGAHVAGALDVVLAAQRIDPDALAAQITGCHRQVRHPQHHGAALAVLGNAEPIINHCIAAGCVQARGAADVVSWHADYFGHRLGRVMRLRDEILPQLEVGQFAALAHELFVNQSFGHHHMRHRVDEGDVAAGRTGKW